MENRASTSDKYAIVTPVRDEEEYIEKLIESVLAQTVRPLKWVIINDGSTDRTEEIVKKYLPGNPWMELLNLPDRGVREPGGDSIFHIGLQRLVLDEIDFFARVDGDISFGADYYEKMIKYFREFPSLGLASGELVYLDHGKEKVEHGCKFQTRGGNKFYRVTCFRDIGGIESDLGWDIVDNIRAIYKGWEARRIHNLKFIHYRPVGSRRGVWGIFENWGKAAYLTGYHPLFFMGKFVRRLVTFPYILGSMMMAYYYLHGFIRRQPRIVGPEICHFIQREQLKKLFGRRSIWS
jgi:glycosyltransferase involved in cell wall biosynthesis